MVFLYRRVLNNRAVNTTDEPDLSMAFDIGEAREVHFCLTVVTPGVGTDAKLVIKHAPVNELDAYRDFATPVEIDLTVAGSVWFAITSFTQFVHWFTSGTLTSDAVVILDLTAKP